MHYNKKKKAIRHKQCDVMLIVYGHKTPFYPLQMCTERERERKRTEEKRRERPVQPGMSGRTAPASGYSSQDYRRDRWRRFNRVGAPG
ncbi:hypothetical protein Baya_3351 [Bagarius yarrelli]|uniref:Uncharacterized protein n=1 Tax=Bagarius yarrelli TaxID=175774 RepID=A0A556TSC3_BAGYA|nr:hypothetical protein Baya_3351 [Bagarius yarrelli]